MIEAIADLKKWSEATREAKIRELEAALRFIIRNQKHEAFFDPCLTVHEIGRKGSMRVVQNINESEEPFLLVNWDECFGFDNQQELFEEIFEGDFSSDKVAKITGVKL